MQTNKDYLKREISQTPLAYSLLFSCTFFGIFAWIAPISHPLSQWSVLAHVVIAVAASAALLPYLWTHTSRTISFRRPFLLATGLLIILLFFLFVISGSYLLIYGQTERHKWIFNLHLLSSLVFIGLILIHIIAHVIFFPRKRRVVGHKIFPSLNRSTLASFTIFNIVAAIGVIGINGTYRATLNVASEKSIVQSYEYSYGNHPFRPSQTETVNGRFIDEKQIATSHRCLSCHNEIGNQWLSSAHRQAASDPTYVTNVSLLANKKGIAATRYCEGCHAPVALLTGQLTPGGQHGGIVGTPANHEGVPCMGCHGISSLTHLKGVASYTFSPANNYLFSEATNPLSKKLHDYLIRLKPEQHTADMGRPILKDPKLCSACHSQFMDQDMNNWGWVKMQDEYGAWLQSPYSQQYNQSYSANEVVRCQDCHMPLQQANDPSANKDGMIRTHNFAAANTMLPFLSGDKEQLAAVTNFLQKNKMRVSIEEPNRKDAVQTLQALNESIRGDDEAPYYYYLGEEATINVVVSNIGVGHEFPGGTIDINQAWLEFQVVDAENNTIYHSGYIQQDNFLAPEAYLYHSIAVDRYGNHVWKHDLFNMVGDSFRRVIKPGQSDVVEFGFEIPSWAKSPVTVISTLKYRKLNQKYSLWALKEQYKDLPVVDVAWDSLSIPLHIKNEVQH